MRFPWPAALAALLLPLIGCAPQERTPQRPFVAAPGARLPPATPAEGPMRRVGLLLPLTGGNAPLGQAMLNASQIALFDQGDRRVEFLPRDTRGTPAGAVEAARAAAQEGAVAFAGPLTLGETAAVARSTGLPVFALTSDEAQASGNVWVLGLTPTQQVRRVMAAAGDRGARRFALLAADDAFGQRLATAMRAAAEQAGWPAPAVQLVAARGADLATAAPGLLAQRPDAVLIGFSGAGARAAAQALAGASPPPLLLGTALWAGDSSLGSEPALAGALFPGPDPAGRERFENQFAAAFEERPPRLAGPAYDAAALAARTAREGAPPVGAAFLGADGPIRLGEGGAVRRGLAVFAVRPGGEPQLVEPAPLPGGAGS
jgi:ABC-type branched-subunit amino acid transport system substrate-binding protein